MGIVFEYFFCFSSIFDDRSQLVKSVTIYQKYKLPIKNKQRYLNMKFGGLQCEVVNGELVFQLTPLNERKIYTMSKNKLFAAHIRRIPLLNGQTTLGLTLQGIILFLQQSRNVKVEKSFWNAINQTIINSLNSKKSVYVQGN